LVRGGLQKLIKSVAKTTDYAAQIERVATFHTQAAGGFRRGEKWQVAERLSATMFVSP
jgi:hypothetical protein